MNADRLDESLMRLDKLDVKGVGWRSLYVRTLGMSG